MCKPELTEEEFSKNITPIVQVRPQVLVNSTILSSVWCNIWHSLSCFVQEYFEHGETEDVLVSTVLVFIDLQASFN